MVKSRFIIIKKFLVSAWNIRLLRVCSEGFIKEEIGLWLGSQNDELLGNKQDKILNKKTGDQINLPLFKIET